MLKIMLLIGLGPGLKRDSISTHVTSTVLLEYIRNFDCSIRLYYEVNVLWM